MISTKKSARASIPAVLAAVFLGSVGSSFAMAQEPALVKAVPPEYPRAAERRDLEGEVVVSIVVGDDGSVSSVTVVSATPPGIFDTAATRAVQRWKFEQGKAATLTKKIQFKLTG